MKFSLTVGLLAATANAHYILPYLVVDGKPTGDWAVTRKTANYQSNGPVTDIKSDAFRCYQLAPGSEGASLINVTAGSTIAVGAKASFSHPGPFSAWLSKVPAGKTALDWNGDGETWVKIYNDSPNISPGGIAWASMNKNRIEFPIPKCIENGEYLLRTEHIGLHGASSPGGAQFYISCHHISVSGGTATWKPKAISIPDPALSPSDPALMINLYWPIPTQYKTWGPDSLTC